MTQITLGAMAKPIHEQMGGEKPKPGTYGELWQRSADAITLLMVLGYLTSSEGHKARRRLFKHMERAMKMENP